MDESTRLDGWGRVIPKGTGAVEARQADLPIIDLTPLQSGDPAAMAALAAELRRACEETGFFYIKNHGISQDLIDATFAAGLNFFSLPLEEKLKIHVNLTEKRSGYSPFKSENADLSGKGDLHECFDAWTEYDESDPEVIAGYTTADQNLWPESLPRFRTVLEEYHGEVRALAGRLCKAFALALDLEPDFFDRLITKPNAHVRLNYYPPQDPTSVDEAEIGIGAHTDYQSFTILAQDDVPALQVMNIQGEWMLVPPIRGTYVVNIGDQMARWTNDRFKSTMHRAINISGKARQSLPYFFGANYDVVIEALPNCTGPGNPAKYPPVIAGQYSYARIGATTGSAAAAAHAMSTLEAKGP